MKSYPHIEQFYRDNYAELLDWNAPLRPSKSLPKNGAAAVSKFCEFYQNTGIQQFTEDDVLQILNAGDVTDGDTIQKQNLRVMRELNFVKQVDRGKKEYRFTEQFFLFFQSGHSVDYYIVEKLMGITSIDDLTMYFNLLVCAMREAAVYGQVILFGDSADKFSKAVPDAQKRKEYQDRVFLIYGFKGDEARVVPENYTPNISYFCNAALKQLGILRKTKEKIDNMDTLELAPLGEIILEKIEENLSQVPAQEQTNCYVSPKPASPLDQPLQQIYYGAPGTGKSNTIKKLIKDYNLESVRTTFHPDSDYSTFVGAYKPTTEWVDNEGKVLKDYEDGAKKQITYKFIEQAFLKAYKEAWLNQNKNVVLVIEEINRGNCAQIFGDLFQLLDRNDDDFSEYPIEADEDLGKHLKEAFGKSANAFVVEGEYEEDKAKVAAKVKNGEVLLLPSNLYIWATMNTSDQSLFPIDSAFKRRWDWEYVRILKGKKDGVELNWKIDVGDGYEWWSFITNINKVISETTHSADKQLGYFFCKEDNGVISAKTFVSKVIFYLWNDVFKDYGFNTKGQFAGLFDQEENGSKKKITFDSFYKKASPDLNTDMILLFFDENHLNVNKWEGADKTLTTPTVESNSADEDTKTKTTFKIDFPDLSKTFEGNTVDRNANQAYYDALSFINEQGYSFEQMMKLGIEQNGQNAFSKERIQGLEQKDLENGYFVQSKPSYSTKKSAIEKIAEKANIKIKVSIENTNIEVARNENLSFAFE